MIRRALISVYDKTGLVELARELANADVEIVSTGSTAATIAEAGVPVTSVSAVTGFAECLDGRVKTLHPHIHAGILADRRNPAHVKELSQLDIAPFDVVVVNLYPFRETVASDASREEIVEMVDIGGPALIRAAAKNHANVLVVVNPEDYPVILSQLSTDTTEQLALRRSLAAKAYAHTASYDTAIASWFSSEVARDTHEEGAAAWPAFTHVTLERAEILRYGENSHQSAALYVDEGMSSGVAQAEQLSGKAMSYNNYMDADAAYRAAYDFSEPAVAIIKHTNPCGLAIGKDIAEAHRKAHATDPLSAFGGVIATNRPVSIEMAQQLADIFTEVIIAPSYDEEALKQLEQKRSLRLLQADMPRIDATQMRQISGGMLLQTPDTINADGDDAAHWKLVAGNTADAQTLRDLRFAWKASRAVKSNAIVLAADEATVGVGMGQVNRVDAARLAVQRAGERTSGAVAASDAFFPFPDGLQILLAAGVRAVVQPGGSVRDDEVIAAATAANITMYTTGVRHFAH